LNETTIEKPPFILSDVTYERVKWIIAIVIPAAGTLYFALATIWGFPAGQQVLGSLIAVQAFLGALFAISTQQYRNSDVRFDGSVTISETDDKHIVAVEGIHPSEMAKKNEVVLKVK
jgi:hypothetical protein